jgi:hypothetical protein
METLASERIDNFAANPFLDGPTEFLVKTMAAELVKVPQFKLIFAEYIDCYRRMDYPIRGLPALRLYNNAFVKEFESWFITGDIICDVIFPASLRRIQTQQLQDTISAALLQQFRRPSFFTACEALVPGLNELGKTFSVDKSRGFQWNDDLVPLTQITVNFRLDLREWDLYLEAQDRTKDDPFERTLGDLGEIITTIQALRDNDDVDLTITTDQQV